MQHLKNLSDWLEHAEHSSSARIHYDLSHVAAVASTLKLSHFDVPIVMVAGTNGKGSCVRTIEQLSLALGLRVATYTSPHVFKFNERLRINGQMASDELFCESFAHIHERHDLPLTYFEFTTLAALRILQQQPLDLVVLEVGLGGRLDAVNCVDADISVITSIDYDHMDFLGDTLESIANEKAGIFKQNNTAICAFNDPPTVIAKHAQALGCRFIQKGVDYQYSDDQDHWFLQLENQTFGPIVKPSLHLDSVAAAIQVLSLLDIKPLQTEWLNKLMPQLALFGRMSITKGVYNEIYDVAHNPASIKWLASQLPDTKIQAVFGMLNTKDIQSSVDMIKPFIDMWHVAPINNDKRFRISELEKIFSDKACKFKVYTTLKEAQIHARASASKGETIVYFGSHHVLAECSDVQSRDILIL